MVFADEIRKTILSLADQRGPGGFFYAAEVARQVDPDNWRNLLDQVSLVATILIKEGKIKTMGTDGNSIPKFVKN